MRERSNGFTLIELLVSITILVIVITTVYGSFRAGLSAYRKQEEKNILHQNIREALFMISRDFRNAYLPSGSSEMGFTGEHDGNSDRVAFVTFLRTTGAKEGGLAGVEYYVDGDPATAHRGLVRISHGFPAGPAAQRPERLQEIASLVKSLKLRYYDGTNWQEEWKKEPAILPAAVEVTVTVAKEENADAEQTFNTIVPVIAGENAIIH